MSFCGCMYKKSQVFDIAPLNYDKVQYQYLITWITTHLPTSEGWMAELAKARSMQPYIILYKSTLQLGVRNLPKVFTRQRPGGESNRVSVIH